MWNKLGKKDPETLTARLDDIRKEGPPEVVALVEQSRQEGFEGKQINHACDKNLSECHTYKGLLIVGSMR